MLQRNREPSRPDVSEISATTVGSALVIHRTGSMSASAQVLAMQLAADPDHDLAVIDLPAELPISVWESVAALLPRRRRGVRFVAGGRSRETVALVGHLLSERLGRTVIAPDGAIVRGAGGALFVHSGHSSGWVRFQPGKAPRTDGKRFPPVSWECDEFADTVETSSMSEVEPLPGGLWLRPAAMDAAQQRHRTDLIATLPVQPDVLTVVVGCPGAAPVTMDDVARMWLMLPEHIRRQAKFAPYGPVSGVSRAGLGQAISDLVGAPVRCYTGLPVGDAHDPPVVTVAPDGKAGWYAFARELLHRPQGEEANLPEIVDHRPPLPGLRAVGSTSYWYSPDAVVEVVQSGLLVRAVAATPVTERIRAVEPDYTVNRVIFDAADDTGATRMRHLANDLVNRLDDVTRRASRVMSVDELWQRPAPAVPLPEPEPVRVTTEEQPALLAVQATEVVYPARRARHRSVVGADRRSAEPDVTAAVAAATPTTRLVLGPTSTPAARTEVIRFGSAEPTAVISNLILGQADEPLVGDAELDAPIESLTGDLALGAGLAAPIEPVAVVSAPLFQPAPAAWHDVDEPDFARQPDGEVVLGQEVPAPAAAAVLPDGGIDKEREWLRRSLAAQFAAASDAVSSALATQPQFESPTSDMITDAVMIQLYLSPSGTAVDNALRSGVSGPHVPIARSVLAGLIRLPNQPGVTVYRTTMTTAQAEYYLRRQVVTEWGFLNTLGRPSDDLPGDTDVLVWSVSARPTALLEPDLDGVPDRMLFLPGARFVLLDVTTPTDSDRGLLILRELTPGETDDPDRALDEAALDIVWDTRDDWTRTGTTTRVPAAALGRFACLPGLA